MSLLKQNLYPISEINEIASGIFSFRINCPEVAQEALPGQFVSILCGEFTLRRPISICEIDRNEGWIRIVFERRGSGTDWLSQRKVGDYLDMLAPIGNGYPEFDDKNKIILVGGGIGVPPMLALAKKYKDKCAVFLGFRDSSKEILSDEFKALTNDVFVATEDGSSGSKGFITTPLDKYDFGENAVICACGPIPLLKKLAKLSAEKNIPAFISLEERMGCSAGACFGCVCNTIHGYKRVCKDGPVFNSSEVIFDG